MYEIGLKRANEINYHLKFDLKQFFIKYKLNNKIINFEIIILFIKIRFYCVL